MASAGPERDGGLSGSTVAPRGLAAPADAPRIGAIQALRCAAGP